MYHKIPIDYYPSSQIYFDAIKHLPFGCWLDSGKPASKQGRFDILSASPHRRLVAKQNIIEVFNEANLLIETLHGDDPFKQLKHYSIQQPVDTDLPFIGGCIGYIGYDLGNQKMEVAYSKPNENALPDMQMGIYHWAIIQDHLKQQSWLTALPSINDKQLKQLQHIVSTVERLPATSHKNTENKLFAIGKLHSNMDKQHYLNSLASIDELIHAGDCYQVNFAQRFSTTFKGDSYYAYLALREAMASPFSAYLHYGNQSILCLSPERFLQVKDRQVMAQPIKGTLKRGQTDLEDKQLAKQLLSSLKDRAENLMIVDLLRNDLSKSCQLGSVKVPELFTLQSFANVHHLVSKVTGLLKPHATSLDALSLSFPGGSITGAPKKRAMEIIAKLEPDNRELYCGSIGYINQNGDMDMNIVIRTVICNGETLSCSGGGGIVADSVAELEYKESMTKINLIIKTLNSFEEILE